MHQMIFDAHNTGFILITRLETHDLIPKDAGDWQQNPFNFAQGEEAMWRAVITQAILDACMQATEGKLAQYKKLEQHKQDAIKWLLTGGEDFLDVCERACLDPKTVRRKAKKAIMNPSWWRTEAGFSIRYEERRESRKRRHEKRRLQYIHQQPLKHGCTIYNLFA